LHFVGHSAFTPDGDSILLLCDENGDRKEVQADTIAQLIGRQNSLQLVVFNSCDGARTTLDDPFASIATMLVQQGKSAVIAMQFEITDAAAKAFAEELYYCLIDRHYPIDAAVAEARIAMLDVNQIEFATPVLFLRPGFVDLFDFKPTPNGAPAAVDAAPIAPAAAAGAVGLPPTPPATPADTPPATPPTGGSKRKRWPVFAGVGVLVVAAAVAGVVALSSGGDDETEATTPVPTTISGESYVSLLDCVESDLFLPPYFDTTSPDSDGFGQCDAARQQLEANGLDAAPIYGTIVDRLTDAGSLSSMMQDETDTPDDHQAFADKGDGLYEELRATVRTLRGLNPSGGVSFATELGDQVTDATADVPEVTYQTIVDDTGTLTVDAPSEWADINKTPLTIDEATEAGYEFVLGDNDEAPRIQASPSIADYTTSYSTPGLVFLALPPQSSLEETLAAFAPVEGECTDAGIKAYDDGAYSGSYQTFKNCGGTSTVYVIVAAVPSDGSFTAVVAIAAVSDADLVALDQVLATFDVTSAASS
jgi:CHAT domain